MDFGLWETANRENPPRSLSLSVSAAGEVRTELMDPYTVGYLAGHSDFSTTRRYVHPQVQAVRDDIERARNGQSGPKLATANAATAASDTAHAA